MAAGKSVADILAGAKAELGRADALSKSTGSGQHEYSSAPYTLARKPAPPKAPDLSDEVKSAAEGIKAKRDQVNKLSQ